MEKRIKTKTISDILVLVIHCTERQDISDGADGERKEVSNSSNFTFYRNLNIYIIYNLEILKCYSAQKMFAVL